MQYLRHSGRRKCPGAKMISNFLANWGTERVVEYLLFGANYPFAHFVKFVRQRVIHKAEEK